MRSYRFAACIAALATAAYAQTSPKSFDVADVHVSAPGTEESGDGLHGGRLAIRGVTMLRLIMAAYGLEEDDFVVGGPTWLDSDRFDIIAKSPPTSTEEDVKAMLRSLLADRFKLTIHNDRKLLPVWLLTSAKRTSQLKEGSGNSECDLTVPGGVRTLTCHNMTMAGLAPRLRQVASGYFNHTVIDKTGLPGGYDFTIKWLPRGQLTAAGHASEGSDAKSVSIFEYLEKQLGLKAEAGKEPLPVIVVDSVNQKPTPNPAGVTEKLPPAPTEFEVADVRPNKTPAEGDINMRNGRLEARAVSLREMITLIFDIDDDMVVGGEKWLDTDKFDIIAKSQPNTSIESLRAMLRTLLEQRFRMKVHREDQPVPVYALTAARRPKLTETSGQERTGCKLGVADGLRTFTCTNITMSQFAEKIRPVAAAYLDHPVVDLTGLTGAYDFVVKWSGKGRVMGPHRGGGDAQPAGAVPSAADPNTALTVFEAVDRQLGLKLAPQKHPLSVVVIDHLERTPTEN